jgi:hypothetical protein
MRPFRMRTTYLGLKNFRPAYVLGLLALWAFFLPFGQAKAQTLFEEDIEIFPTEFSARLALTKTAYADEYLKTFKKDWDESPLSPGERKNVIKQVNRLLKRKFSITEIAVYMKTILNIRSDRPKIRIPVIEFMAVTDSASLRNKPADVVTFFRLIEAIVPEGNLFQSPTVRWQVSQQVPKLIYKIDRVTDSLTGATKVTAFPALVFSSTNLSFISKNDSSVMFGVKGLVNLTNKIFYIDEARYTWMRLKQDPSQIYVDLKDFQLRLTSLVFKCDSAVLHYDSFLGRTLRGTFSENLIHYPNPETAEHPYFKSTEGGLRIEKFIENVAYEGGFSLRGLTKYGSRTPEQYATLHIYNKDQKEVLRLESNEFALNPSRMLTNTALVALFLPGGDSLTHPSMALSYDVKTRLMALKLNRKDPLSRQPIFDSYHKYNLYFEVIEWQIGTDTVHFKAFIDQEHKYFAIESQDFFRMDRYLQFKGVLAFQPMSLIYQFMLDKPYIKNIPLESLIKQFKLTEDSPMAIELAMIDLQGSGYIKWDPVFKVITPTERLSTWARAARNFKDYDAIQILTNIDQGDNALMNYNTKVMEMRGVRTFTLSDSQLVVIKPQGDRVFVGKNRNLKFGGRVFAGKINLLAKGYDKFSFDYEAFKVDCDSIDSLKFVPKRDPTFNFAKFQNKKLVTALEKLRIEGVSGAVYINKPTNRSGKKKMKQYPVFDCYTFSFVYWADPKIQGGVYTKDKVKFTVDPFVLDSLETFDITQLEFAGELKTGDIFPAFDDTLKPVADNTYGVREKMPEGGVPIYKGKGQYFNIVEMDGFGLHGDGKLQYLSTVAESDTFIFHLDSVMAFTRSFEIKPGDFGGANFPQMKAGRIKFRWYPWQDKQVLTTDKDPVDMFGGQAQFRGQLYLTPKGLKGDGTLTIGQMQVRSTAFTFKENSFTADSSEMKISYPDMPNRLHLLAKRMNLQYDMQTHKGNFRSLTIGQPDAEFPENKFATSMGIGEYDRNAGIIKLKAKDTYASANFLQTTDSAMHGLKFQAKEAVYTMATNEMKVSGTDTVAVADAFISPSNGNLVIRQGGKIDPLAEATITAQQVGKYHTLFDANAQILSGIDYKASAKYSYLGLPTRLQTIDFGDITVRKPDTTTFAVAQIPEEQGFLITDRIFFRGKVELEASRRFMRFTGQVKIQSSNALLRDSWFELDDVVNPDSIFIKLSQKKLGEQTVGLHYVPNYRLFYSNFIARRRAKTDKDIMLATGTDYAAASANSTTPIQEAGLSRDKLTGEFRLGPANKLKGQSQYRGNVISYDDSGRVVTSTGYLNFPYHQPPGAADIQMAGAWKDDQKKGKISTNLVMVLNAPVLPKTIMEKYGERILSLAGLNEEVDFTQRPLQEALAEVIDNDATNEANIKRLALDIQTSTQVAQIKVNKYYAPTLLLSGVKFNWNDSLKALYYLGPVGVISANGTTINRQVNVRMDYRFGKVLPNGKSFDDTLRILLEPDEANWIYVELYGYKLRIGSTFDSYNRMVTTEGAKIDAKRKPDDQTMTLEAASEMDHEQYLSTFAQRYIYTQKRKKATDN